MTGMPIERRLLRRGRPGYEEARRAAVWNARTPARYPDCIAVAEREEDVVAAVAYARAAALRIGIRSGGHSFSGSHLRDGGMLLDVSRLTDVAIDAASRTAAVGPGCLGGDLDRLLALHGLSFPVGHCPTVALGGYLLLGGIGWNSRVLGPACQSVTAIDVVTADGELVRADATRHPDLYWAARGSGPGFFGAVTRFHLELHPRSPVVMASATIYPGEALGEVLAWARDIGPQVPRATELSVVVRPDVTGAHGTAIAVEGVAHAESEDAARAALAPLDTCPAGDHALSAAPPALAPTPALAAELAASYPAGSRYAVDNMWTSASGSDLLPGVRRIAHTLPPDPSHLTMMNWGPSPARPDMAYSLEDDVYIGVYGIWTDSADDAAFARWATDRMRELEPLASGIQLGDENLGLRPARFASDEAMRRLDEVRSAYDPHGCFHPWLGRL